jgi:DHA1 family bicyclomycin/chloramphenicol resistance-like MFS transporter
LNILFRPPLGRRAAPNLPLLVAITALGTMGLHMFIPALPATAHDLHAAAGTIQLTVTLYVLGLAAGQSVYGPLSDRYGRRPLLLIGMTLYVVASIAAALAGSVGQLLVARVMQALGACSGLVLGRAMCRDGSTPDKAAATMATLMTAMTVSPALAPPIGGYLAAWLGWRATFGAIAFAAITVLTIALLTLPETLKNPNPEAGILRVVGSYGGLLRLPTFRGYGLGGCCASTSLYAFFSASPFILVNVLHRPASEVGLYFLVPFGAISLGAFTSSRLVKRFRSRSLARAGSIIQLTGAVLLMTVELTGHLSVVTLMASILIVSYAGGMAGPNATVLALSADPKAVGAASGLYGTAQMIYGALCTAAVSLGSVDSAMPTAIVLFASAVIGQISFAYAARHAPA